MSWTEERIDTLKTMWQGGHTASQIAESLGGVSRNAVIGKAHRLGLQSRPSPVVSKEDARIAAEKAAAAQAAAAPAAPPPAAAAPVAPPVVASAPPPPKPEPRPRPVAAAPVAAPPVVAPPVIDAGEDEDDAPFAADSATDDALAAPVPEAVRAPIMRSVGPGGFVRQSPGEQQPPSTPAPPRRLVPARASPEFAGKTSLLDLNDKICKWPLGHPGEPDFHFCGDKVNPGFPYCVNHCGHAYQAQLPRRDRRAGPLPFGGPRMR